MIIWPFYQ